MSIKIDETRIKEHRAWKDDGDNGAVIYFMQRDQRVHDNWALLYAQEKAVAFKVPLLVIVCIDPKWYPTTMRHFEFMKVGLEEVHKTLKSYNISCVIEVGNPETVIPVYVKKHKASGLITDFSPLQYHQKLLKKLYKKMTCALYEVDAHNIVPCWMASQKQEYAARTLRPKIHKKLKNYLIEFPRVKKQSYVIKHEKDPHWESLQKKLHLDTTIKPVSWIKPGEKSAQKGLRNFIKYRLKVYASLRNDPTEDAQSELSPYLHFGHISAQRVALEVHKVRGMTHAINDFLEELIVRKELSDNYCFYNAAYDSLRGAPEWAQKTLQQHSKDKREYLYTKQKLEQGKTHDELWNAAQMQLVHHGKLHGYMRMYWAKKILEWTSTPKKAYEYALEFNDKYSLDGTDPNGYVGVAWSIAGVHDRPWFVRKVFGSIRYMSYAGCKSKFDIKKYCQKVEAQIKKEI